MQNKNRRPDLLKGRGASHNPPNRYHGTHHETSADAPGEADRSRPSPITRLTPDAARTVLTTNESPDVGPGQSVNPYRGCEHGCVYCFARPTHAYLDLSPGLDFETRIFYKEQSPELLKKELSRPSYRCQPLALGINTDAYQPAENQLGLTRRILENLLALHHPVTLVTKSSLVERDIDILVEMARLDLVHVHLSITTLDAELARRLEPRAAVPERRLRTIRALAERGVPVGVMVAPVIPVLTESEVERILEEARSAGARSAGYVLLRLPLEIGDLFERWLDEHVPDKKAAVLSAVREFHGGKTYDSRFGVRMRGTGIRADLLEQRFRLQVRRQEFPGLPPLRTDLFAPVAAEKSGKKTSKPLFPGFS
ncbi:MAG: PA0069 family radical SAM protein [Nitrospirae bacterium]|jgi:DNA repair photolyase|nr:PA0069 family radical SAM protein [Nitrospirota bacterium]